MADHAGDTSVRLAALADRGDDPDVRAAAVRLRGILFGEHSQGDEPTRFGRYRVRGVLGRGGQGVIYLADDPTLGRAVAIKVIERVDAATERRFKREARLLAQLAHPQIAAIYDIGRAGDRLYFAMEYLRGETMQQWIARRPPPRRALQMMIAIGHVLAAAHRVGVIHRDVKPANVLVDHEGRAHVLDFGLAVSRVAIVSDAGASIEIGMDSDDASHPGAATPAVEDRDGDSDRAAGTPAYAAPEAWLGRPVDARADQFGFCVMLLEALGARPRGALGRRLAASPAQVVELPASLDHNLRSVLRRGLAADPEHRFADMDALLARLTRSRGRGPQLAVLCATVLGGATWSWAHGADHPPACPEPDDAELWSAATRTDVDVALAAASPESIDVGARVGRELDTWDGQWRKAWADSCTLEPAAAQGLRACLSRRRNQFAIAIELLLHSDRDLAARATELVDGLGDPQDCSGLSAVPMPPVDPARLEAERQLAVASVFEMAHRASDAHAAAELACATLEHDPDPRWRAECNVELGAALVRIGRVDEGRARLEQGHLDADAAGRDDLALFADRSLAWIENDRGHTHRAEHWAADASARAIRLGDRVSLLRAQGLAVALAVSRGEFEAAAAELERQWVASRGVLGVDERFAIGMSSAIVASRRLDFDFAMRRFEELLALARELDPRSPLIAAVLIARAQLERELGAFEDALAHDEEALALIDESGERLRNTRRDALDGCALSLSYLGRFEEALGYARRGVALAEEEPDSRDEVQALLTLAFTLLGTNDPAPAERAAARALAIGEAVLGTDDVVTINAQMALARASLALGKSERARDLASRSVEALERTLGPDHIELAASRSAVAEAELALGHPEAALAQHARVLAIIEGAHGPEHPILAVPLFNLAEIELALGRLDVAHEHAARGLALYEASLGAEHPDSVDTRALLARIDKTATP